MAPLTALVQRLRQARGDVVPFFDPIEAGVRARIVLLLEAPGRRAVTNTGFGSGRGGSGFVSADNNDQTAQNSWQLLRDAGIDRSRMLLTWNVVPWYLGDDTRIRPATMNDLDEARPALLELLGLLSQLRAVVLLGRKAQSAWQRAGMRGDAMVLMAPHPSPLVINTRPGAREAILEVLVEARNVASRDDNVDGHHGG